MDRRIRPWINKKIIEYIGEEEPTLVDFVCSKVSDYFCFRNLFFVSSCNLITYRFHFCRIVMFLNVKIFSGLEVVPEYLVFYNLNCWFII